MKELAAKLIPHLRGTCMTIYEALKDFNINEGDLTDEQMEELLEEVETEIWCCTLCGWWDNVENFVDLGYGYYCEECMNEEDEDFEWK